MGLSQSKLYVFTNHRAIRDYISKNYEKNALLDKLITIDEFEKRAQLFENRQFIDDDQRDIILKEAADFSGFELLKIEKDFLKFIKSSTSILKFFEELSKERVTFEEIRTADTYAEYESHLNVLKTLYSRYTKLLEENMYVDAVNAPDIYKINFGYLKNYEEIHLFFEGYLSKYEIGLIERISKEVEIFMHISTSFFTKKMHERFEGFKLEPNKEYIINISKRKIKKEKIVDRRYQVDTYSSPTRLFQAAAVKKIMYDFFKNDNIDPQKTAVILPDEEFVSVLSLYDYEKNYNYAMGAPFCNEHVYKKLQTIYDLRIEESHENILRAKRFGIAQEIYHDIWDKNLAFEELMSLFEEYKNDIEDNQVQHTYLSHLYNLKKIKNEIAEYPLKEIFHLFLNRLVKSSTDMAGGGNITVMGALESRGVEFDAVIVCDFNEGFVPKENKKDLYLNSTLRMHAGLPTRGDRQNLQLDLYHNLFLRAKRSAVIYVHNEESAPSTFLRQLGIDKEPLRIGDEYSDLLYKMSKQVLKTDERIELEIDLTKKSLSATKLKDYISCGRKYYHKYIGRIKDYQIPSDENEAYVMGNLLHETLNKIFTKKSSYTEEKELFNDIEVEFKKLIKDDIMLQFEGDIWLKRLKSFCTSEIKRFRSGFEVFKCEEKFECDFNGIRLEGVIDRIDKKNGKLTVIDYKSGSFPVTTKNNIEKTKDFQLLFYSILASVDGDVDDLFYYDLKSSATHRDDFLSQKKEMLANWLQKYKQKRQNFEKTDDMAECRYCPYKIICGRE